NNKYLFDRRAEFIRSILGFVVVWVGGGMNGFSSTTFSSIASPSSVSATPSNVIFSVVTPKLCIPKYFSLYFTFDQISASSLVHCLIEEICLTLFSVSGIVNCG